MNTLNGFSPQVMLQRWQHWQGGTAARLMRLALPSGFIALSYLAFGAFAEEEKVSELLSYAVMLLPIPLFFLLWLRTLEYQAQTAQPAFSLFFCCLTFALLTGAQAFGFYAVAAGFAASLFIFISPLKMWRLIRADRRMFRIALLGGSAAIGYAVAQHYLWDNFCNAIAHFIRFAMTEIFSIPFSVQKLHNGFGMPVLSIGSGRFALVLFPFCSGLEGVFLFIFLLSGVVLLDWKLFKDHALLDMYLSAVIYMFFINILRICAYFLLGHWAFQPNASAFAYSMREWPLQLFHSWVGWVTYLVAFTIFIGVVYQMIARRHRIPAR